MKALAMSFYATLTARGNLTVSGTEITLQSVYDKGDVLTTGISFQFTAVEKQGKCLDGTPAPARVLEITQNGDYDVTAYEKVTVNIE